MIRTLRRIRSRSLTTDWYECLVLIVDKDFKENKVCKPYNRLLVSLRHVIEDKDFKENKVILRLWQVVSVFSNNKR